MKHREALMKLTTALRIVGLREDDLSFDLDGEDGDVRVTCDYPNGNSITVLVSEFWRYPTMSCYFVNFRHVGGNFVCNVGTPHIEQALVDFGTCINSFVSPEQVAA